MKKITYLKNWTHGFKEFPDLVLSEKAVKARHAKRKPYAVVIENEDDVRVLCFWFTGFYCQVLFVDEYYRSHQTYAFEAIQDEKQLFLISIRISFYKEQGFYSENDGEANSYTMEGEHKRWSRIEGYTVEQLDPKSLTHHYEPMFAFGDYDSIVRFDRTVPPEQDSRRPGHLMIAQPSYEIDWEGIFRKRFPTSTRYDK